MAVFGVDGHLGEGWGLRCWERGMDGGGETRGAGEWLG